MTNSVTLCPDAHFQGIKDVLQICIASMEGSCQGNHLIALGEADRAIRRLAAEPTLQDVTDKTHPRFIAGYTAGLNDARLEAGDTPPPQAHLSDFEGIKPAHPDVNALRRLVVEIRARSPALSEGGRLLPFLEYLLSLLVRQNHAAELESEARVPTPPPANKTMPTFAEVLADVPHSTLVTVGEKQVVREFTEEDRRNIALERLSKLRDELEQQPAPQTIRGDNACPVSVEKT